MRVATLLLTDVVDSTQLTEELGTEAMAEVWVAHDRLARDLLVQHGGREIDKTDGFLLLFDDVSAAVAYSLAYHCGLRGLATPIQARAGIHVGEVLLRTNTPADVSRGAKPLEVEGLAKPYAARIMSLAQGGQTLLSPSAHTALGDTDHRTTSHGHWRMKGVIDPVELFEVGDEHAPFTPPPDSAKVWRVVLRNSSWVPVREVEHTLIRERDAFVGRQKDLLELARLLDGGAALISILGIGGTGKTRLVTRYGWTWLGAWPGGVYFADLSEARSVDGIVSALGRGLRIPVTSRDPVEQIGFAIEARGKCLVILDNFEQVTRHAGETLGNWLDAAPQAQFVVTSREVLGLPGERAMALPPLSQEHAVALFAERGAAAKRGFALTEANLPPLTELVELLDRLPLAIELAAARVRMMPPKKLLQRMDQRFKLLTSTGGRRDRQATLRAAIDWSWDLLSDDEKSGLAQLSSFEGGFTLEAAEAVLECGDAWGTDILQALIDKSLVRQVTDERFDLLVSVQAYATEKLEASEEREDTWQRHAAHYAELDDWEIWLRLGVGDDGPRPEELYVEIDNLIVACRRCMAAEWWGLAKRAALAAGRVAFRDGPTEAGAEMLHALDAAGQLDARGLVALGTLLWTDGAAEQALDVFERAVAMDEGSYWGDRAIYLIATRLAQHGESERAEALLDNASRHPSHRGLRLRVAGKMSAIRGAHAESEALFRGWLANNEAHGMQLGECLLNIGNEVARQGRPAEAEALWRRAEPYCWREGRVSTAWYIQGNLGELECWRGGMQEGLARTTAAMHGLKAMGQAVGSSRIAAGASMLLLVAGMPKKARAQSASALSSLENAGRGERFIAHVTLGASHRMLGELAAARVHLETAASCPMRQSAVLGHTQLALLNLEEGAQHAAMEHAVEAMKHRKEAGEHASDPCVVLAQVHIARGELHQARAVLDTAWSGEPPALWAADLHGCEALLAATHGDREAYTSHLTAIAQWPELGHPDSPLGRMLALAAAEMEDACA